ncbi:MAG: ribonuclease HII [Oligoflexales bacterium]|nr:ribonuclease HII [Oligoflexales bacterium]
MQKNSELVLQKGLLEERLLSEACSFIVGVDEVGRGCLAGPVYAAAVLLDYNAFQLLDPKTKALIRDSKTLSYKQRSSLEGLLLEISISAAIGVSPVDEIENFGILKATFIAMQRAVDQVSNSSKIDILLLDGNQKLPSFKGKQQSIVGGDNLCYCISAASILAKQARDHFMQQQADIFPNYGFEQHVGYGTKLHLDMLTKYGITPLHRRNFAPVKRLLNEQQQI